MEKACEHCPYRHDVKPYLTPQRGEELAYHAQNPYNSFPCHKTTVDEDDGDERLCTNNSKECAGFLSLQINEGAQKPKGFEVDKNAYDSTWNMLSAYGI